VGYDADTATERIHRELFVSTNQTEFANDAGVVPSTVTVTLDNATTQMTTAGDESLLEAALRTGIDAPYWCTGGAWRTDLAEQRGLTAPQRVPQSDSFSRHGLPPSTCEAVWPSGTSAKVCDTWRRVVASSRRASGSRLASSSTNVGREVSMSAMISRHVPSR